MLPVGTQQRIEIVKALVTQAPIIIFDEPTAVLAGDEVEELFGVLRRLRDEGRTILLIAHKLTEILAVSDRVTVLRHGRNVVTAITRETTTEQLAAWMIGERTEGEREKGRGGEKTNSSIHETHERERTEHAKNHTDNSPINRTETEQNEEKFSSSPLLLLSSSSLAVQRLTVRGERGKMAVNGVTFGVDGGEILGIGGVDGNGQTELAEALAGLRPVQGGEIRWNGGKFRAGIAPRIGYIPQDRRAAGLATTLSVEENLLLEAAQSKAYRRGFFLKRRALEQLVQKLVTEFDVRTNDARLPASSLSGGNQQKIVAARALQSEPELIVAVNPTRGLDLGATRFVHNQLRAAKARGAMVVLISTDWDELAALADRAAILSGGNLTEYDLTEQDATQLGLLLGGATVL